MSDLVQIIRRELLERKMLMIGSLAIGALILLIAFAPGDPPIPGIWNVLSMWWSIMGLLGLSAYAGSSFVASELRENRFSFYLARPVETWKLWVGKMLAAWLLALICAFLIVVPVTLTGNGLVLLFTKADERQALLTLALLGVALVLVVFGHAAGVILRARSAWLLLDFVAFSLASLVYIASLRLLFLSFAFGLLSAIVAVSIVALSLMLTVAGYLGIESGRTDLARVHRMTSIATAVALLLTALAVALVSWMIRSTEPDELRTVQVLECGTLECNPAFSGSALGTGDFHPLFTVVDQTVIPLPMGQMAGTNPDGDWAVWITPITTKILDFEFDFTFQSSEMNEPSTLGLQISSLPDFALEGDRFAFLERNNLNVIDLPQKRTVLSMRVDASLENWAGTDITFVDPNHLILIGKEGPASYRIRSVDIETAEIKETGSFAALAYWQDDAFLVSREGLSRRVVEPRTGKTLVERNADDVVIAGDRAVFETGSRPTVLEVTDLEGSTIREIPLPGSTDAVLGELVPDGRLAVSVRQSGRFSRDHWSESRLLLVDLESGAIEEVAPDLVPARVQNPRVRGPWYLESLPEDRSRLVRFEPGTEMEIIAGPAR